MERTKLNNLRWHLCGALVAMSMAPSCDGSGKKLGKEPPKVAQEMVGDESDDVSIARIAVAKACEANKRESCHNLGEMWRRGDGGAADSSKARVFFDKACGMGMSESCHSLGLMWSKGEGGDADLSEARSAYAKACDAK